MVYERFNKNWKETSDEMKLGRNYGTDVAARQLELPLGANAPWGVAAWRLHLLLDPERPVNPACSRPIVVETYFGGHEWLSQPPDRTRFFQAVNGIFFANHPLRCSFKFFAAVHPYQLGKKSNPAKKQKLAFYQQGRFVFCFLFLLNLHQDFSLFSRVFNMHWQPCAAK